MFINTIGTVIRQLSLFITFPYFSLYIKALGGSNIDIGFVNALLPLAAMLIYPIAGNLADSYNRVKILVGVLSLQAALHTLYILAQEWEILAIANFLNGVLVFRFPAESSLMADSMSPGLRGRAFAFMMVLPGIVGIFSPFIGGYLITFYGIKYAMRMLYGITTLSLILIAVINWKYMKETRIHKTQKRDFREILISSYRQVFETLRWMPRNLRWYALIIAISLFFNSIAGSYWVIHAIDVVGINELDWGTLLLVATVIRVLIAFPAGIILDKYERNKVLAAALLLSVIPILFFPFISGFLNILFILIPISVSNAFLGPGAGALMADLIPKERRGRTMASLGRGMLFINTSGGGGRGPGIGFLLTFPSIIGLMLGGYIYEVGKTLPWLLLGGATMFSALIMMFQVKKSSSERA